MTKKFQEALQNPENIAKASLLAAQFAIHTNNDWFTLDKSSKKLSIFNETKAEIKNKLDTLVHFGFCAVSGGNVGGPYKVKYRIIITLEDQKTYLEHQLSQLELQKSDLIKQLIKVNDKIAEDAKINEEGSTGEEKKNIK